MAPASGSDEKEEKRKAVAMASRALRVAVARQRRSHAQAIRRLPPGAGTNEVDRLATRYLPDYALPYAVHNIARTTRDDAKVAKALLLLLEPLVATAGDKGVAFLLAACADMSGHDDASGSGPCPFDHVDVAVGWRLHEPTSPRRRRCGRMRVCGTPSAPSTRRLTDLCPRRRRQHS